VIATLNYPKRQSSTRCHPAPPSFRYSSASGTLGDFFNKDTARIYPRFLFRERRMAVPRAQSPQLYVHPRMGDGELPEDGVPELVRQLVHGVLPGLVTRRRVAELEVKDVHDAVHAVR